MMMINKLCGTELNIVRVCLEYKQDHSHVKCIYKQNYNWSRVETSFVIGAEVEGCEL